MLVTFIFYIFSGNFSYRRLMLCETFTVMPRIHGASGIRVSAGLAASAGVLAGSTAVID